MTALADDVARELERRRARRRRFTLAVIGALAVAAALLIRCGGGWGIGGTGHGGTGKQGDGVAVKRCALRVTASGIFVDGVRKTQDDAVSRCEPTGAEVTVTGDAREGDWRDLESALQAAGVDVVVRQR